jgi:hypothetical protein
MAEQQWGKQNARFGVMDQSRINAPTSPWDAPVDQGALALLSRPETGIRVDRFRLILFRIVHPLSIHDVFNAALHLQRRRFDSIG